MHLPRAEWHRQAIAFDGMRLLGEDAFERRFTGVSTSATAVRLLRAAAAGADLQTPMNATVVIPTVLWLSLYQALLSVFAQAAGGFAGRVHVLVGMAGCGLDMVEAARLHRPAG